VSRHLRVLRDAGAVTSRAVARHRIYRLEPEPPADVSGWLDRTRDAWQASLDALETELRRKEAR
jgi:DNA-binding transcriptional ArsR family regulator